MKKEIVDKIIASCFEVEEHLLNDKGMYEGFYQDIGYDRRWFSPETTYWWVEDLVKDTLEKEKVFGDRPIILTRHLKGKDPGSLGAVFKGPISSVDLWIPGYGFGEIKYTSDCQKDVFGYDLNNRAIDNIYSIRSLEFNMTHKVWKNNKLFLIIVHCPDLGDKVSISIIDLYDKFAFISPWDKEKTSKPRFHPNISNVKVGVRAENCMARFDSVPYRKYYKRCHEKK